MQEPRHNTLPSIRGQCGISLKRASLCLLTPAFLCLAGVEAPQGDAARVQPQGVSMGMIQIAPLDPSIPLFIPTHPRVTTTLRFPSAPGAPEGKGFTEDETKHPGEYLVCWNKGDSHLTVTPLGGAGPLNLNIPYRQETYVFYFYPVQKQFEAIASLRLVQPDEAQTPQPPRMAEGPSKEKGGAQQGTQMGRDTKPSAGTAQLTGFLDKLHLLRASVPGKGRSTLANKLLVEINEEAGAVVLASEQEESGIETRVHILAKDTRTEVIGVVLGIKNTTTHVIGIEEGRPALSCENTRLQTLLTTTAGILFPGEEAELIVLASNPEPAPLELRNNWTLRLRPVRVKTGAGKGPPSEVRAMAQEGT